MWTKLLKIKQLPFLYSPHFNAFIIWKYSTGLCQIAHTYKSESAFNDWRHAAKAQIRLGSGCFSPLKAIFYIMWWARESESAGGSYISVIGEFKRPGWTAALAAFLSLGRFIDGQRTPFSRTMSAFSCVIMGIARAQQYKQSPEFPATQ